ncbi:MAG: signal peptide peptidase SppA [Verrucomicrobiota bacterium]
MDQDPPANPNPGNLTPPPLYPPTPPPLTPRPKKKRSLGWIIVLILVLSLGGLGLGLLLLLGFVGSLPLSPSLASSPSSFLQEVLVEDNDSRNKIALVNLSGIITDGAIDASGYSIVRLIQDQLELAADDPRVRAVVLIIDSPGGEVLASDEIYRAIEEFQDEAGKPVIASMQSLAASGGYYAAAPCRWIVAHELTLTGSIGVIMQGYNYRGLMDKVGVRPEVFKSGRFKDMLSGSKREQDVSPEERQMVQTLVDETFSRFKHVVRKGRNTAHEFNGDSGRQLSPSWEEYADGRILSGTQAYEHGFVDELGNFEQAVERAYRITGISSANLIRYQRPFDLGNIFRLLGQSPKDKNTVKIQLGPDTSTVQSGRLYYLSPALLP